MDLEFKRQFEKAKYGRKEAMSLYRAYNDYQLDVDIPPALAEWFNLFEDEKEERYIAATWRSRV